MVNIYIYACMCPFAPQATWTWVEVSYNIWLLNYASPRFLAGARYFGPFGDGSIRERHDIQAGNRISPPHRVHPHMIA